MQTKYYLMTLKVNKERIKTLAVNKKIRVRYKIKDDAIRESTTKYSQSLLIAYQSIYDLKEISYNQFLTCSTNE
jgi:hypothetical protein